MKISSIFLLIIGLNSWQLFGQVSSNASTTTTDSRYFDLDVLNNSDEKLSKTLHLNVIAVYSKINGSENLKVSIDDTASEKSFVLKYPLLFSEMSGQFNSNKTISNFTPVTMSFTNRSLLLVYYWLNNFNKDKNEAPLSGILHVKPFVKVYETGDKDRQEISPEADEWLQPINGLNIEIEKHLKQFKKTNDSLKLMRKAKDSSIIARLKEDSIKLANGISSLNEKITIFKNRISSNNYHTISDVNLQFERGFLEKVQVVLTSPNQQAMIFENYFAIGFTSPSNFRNIYHTPLYFRTDRFSDRANYRIYLGDVLSNYFNELDNYTRDYSPADTTVKHIDPSKTPLVYLHRARRVDLVDTKIYTDLLGLADKNPNGVLQTEISKRLNIFTYRKPLQFKTNIGFVNYIDLEGSVSKFEQKERILTLRNEQFFANQQLLSPSYATALDFMRYQTIGLGAAVNAFVFDVPEWKSTFTLDGGFRYIRIPVADSIRQLLSGKYTATINSDVPAANMITWFPKLKLELFSERRYGFYCAWMFNYSNIYTNNQYKYVASYEKSDLKNLAIEKSAHFSNTIEFFARFEPNPSDASGKIFFRTRITFQKGDMNTNFNQIQVGYAYNIVYKK